MNRREFLVGAAAVVAHPRLALEPARPVALATADLESRVVAVDLRTGRVRTHISTEWLARGMVLFDRNRNPEAEAAFGYALTAPGVTPRAWAMRRTPQPC